MLQRILGVVLVLAGLGAIAFGAATATVLRESDTVVATARPVGDGTMVVTDPGVLGLVAADVTVTASVPAGQEVTLVVARDVDVTGWIGQDPYTRVTGLSDWETLSTEAVVAEPAEGEDAESGQDGDAERPVPDPSGSDMWASELTDAEQVSLRWSDRPGRWVVLAAGTGPAPVEDEDSEQDAAADGDGEDNAEADDQAAEAPTLELTWDREVATPLLWPAVGVGGVLVLIGLVLLVTGRRRTKRAPRTATAPGASSEVSPLGASSASGDTPDPEPSSPFHRTTGAASAAATWPAAVATADPTPEVERAPVAARVVDTPEQERSEDGSTVGTDDSEESANDGRAGTAPVPVAGRFPRRSRLRRARSAEAAEAPSSDGQEPQPSAAAPQAALPAAAAEDRSAEASRPATGSHATLPDGRPLTRRELRRREEERRAAEQTGMGRALRALTGQTPVVSPPADDGAPSNGDLPGGRSASRRAAAWRETWGFGESTTGAAQDPQQDDTTDGGAR